MPDWISKEFLLALIISLSVVLIALLWGGPPYQSEQPPGQQRGEHSEAHQAEPQHGHGGISLQIECNPNCSAKNADEHRDQSRLSRFIDKSIDDPVATFTLFLAVATVLLVGVVLMQVRDARISSERQLRAYVFNDHASLVDFDDIPTIQVLIKNAGQTPAFSVVAWNAVVLAQVPLIKLERPAELTITRCNLGPGMSFHVTTRLDALPQTKRAAIRAGSEALYVHGRADYIDAFGANRFLTWRLLYGEDSARRPDGSLEVHAEGNEAN
jgi:hypothetical protein